MEKVYIEVMCPICGKMMGKINVHKVSTDKAAKSKYYHVFRKTVNYLDYLDTVWDESKDFWGIVRDATGGKGKGFPIVGYLRSPEDNKELFEKWKKQILQGIKWVLKRKWLNKEEILKLIE